MKHTRYTIDLTLKQSDRPIHLRSSFVLMIAFNPQEGDYEYSIYVELTDVEPRLQDRRDGFVSYESAKKAAKRRVYQDLLDRALDNLDFSPAMDERDNHPGMDDPDLYAEIKR